MNPKQNTHLIALVDCNNFFVSCERIFRPDLETKPVVVLSSNDGCAVARSNEAKALGIPMGAPAFKYRQLFNDHNVVQFSGNFDLYGDISRRITDILTAVCPRIEVYSVDESFLDISHLAITNLEDWGSDIRRRILREVGVPVSIGIGATKTLAKLASEIAKQRGRLDRNASGVFSFINLTEKSRESLLAQTPIKEIWGIGWRSTPKLRAEGIQSALDIARLRPQHAQQLMGIHGRQMVAELNGVVCHPLERLHKAQQSIARTRTFGEDTAQAYVLEAAITSLTAQAAFNLRRNDLLTNQASLFITTNKHKPGYRTFSQTVRFATPTNDSGLLIGRLIECLARIYNPQQSYHRAGVLFGNLASAMTLQTDLLGSVDLASLEFSKAKMQAIDNINQRFGQGRIHFAAEDLSKSWKPKRQLSSPRRTTRWDELELARITGEY